MKDLFWGYRLTPDGKVLDPDGTPRPIYIDPAGYEKVSLRNPNTGDHVQYWVHRLLGLNYVNNPCPGVFTVVDHIDQTKNNKLSNLRWLTQQLNVLNNSADCVFLNKKWRKWESRVCKKTYGWFKKREDAVACSKKHKAELFSSIYKWHLENYEARSWLSSSLTSNRCPLLSS